MLCGSADVNVGVNKRSTLQTLFMVDRSSANNAGIRLLDPLDILSMLRLAMCAATLLRVESSLM
jgi:hypothetical protein